MAHPKKPMTENEKKAKLSVLRDVNSHATGAMKSSLSKYKDSPALKKHTKEMSEDMEHDVADDVENIEDPTHHGNFLGRHVSDEAIDQNEDEASEYDIDELDARIAELTKLKEKAKRG